MKTKVCVLFSLILALSIISCGKISGEDDEKSEKLKYEGKIAEIDIYARVMEVSYDGKIFLMESSDSPTYNKIQVYSTDGDYLGIFTDENGEEVTGSICFIDNSNLLNVFSIYDEKRVRYKTDGTIFDELDISYVDYSVAVSDGGVALTPDGKLLLMETSYWSSINNLDIAVLDKDLIVKKHIQGSSVASLFEDFDESKDNITSIGYGNDGEILITIDRNNEKYEEEDGVLVLNADLTKKRFVGKNWKFNGPWDVITDSEGYYYVANYYHGNIKVFNKDWDEVAKTDGNDDYDIMEYPSVIAIRDGYLYVLGWDDKAKINAIHKFKTYKKVDDETADDYPEPGSGGDRLTTRL